MAAGFRLTVRIGPRVERSSHATLDAALDALDARLAARAPGPTRPARLLAREIPPVGQVVARGEIAGPRRRARRDRPARRRVERGVDGPLAARPW